METADSFHFFSEACQKGIFKALQEGAGILLSDTDPAKRLSGRDGGAVFRILEAGKCRYFSGGIGETIRGWLTGNCVRGGA